MRGEAALRPMGEDPADTGRVGPSTRQEEIFVFTSLCLCVCISVCIIYICVFYLNAYVCVYFYPSMYTYTWT